MKNFLAMIAVLICFTNAYGVTIGTNAEYLRGGTVEVDDPKSGPPPSILVSTALVPTSRGLSIDAGPGNARAANVLGITAVSADALFVAPDPNNPQQLDEVRAEATFSEMVTNSSASAEDFFYDFSIFAPNLKIADFAGAEDGVPGAPTATYNIEIKVDGSIVFNSSASLNGGRLGTALTKSGTDLGDGGITNPGGGGIFEVQFNDYSDSLLLGNFASGQTFLFETLVEVSANSFPFELGGAASVGDPGNIDNVPGVSGAIRSAGGPTGPGGAIPEPLTATLGLMGLGVLGVVTRRCAA